jgi:GGDEF domain-containing protein
VATRLLQTIAQPFRIDGHVLAATPSIGIALYPQDGANFDALSRLADTAMYWAKQGGRNTFRFYKHEPEHSVGVPPQP